MRIREATEPDVLAIVAMAERFIASSVYHRWLHPAPAQLDGFIQLVLDIGVIYVAELEPSDPAWTPAPPAELVGMIAGFELPHPITGERYVDEAAWWVEPTYRNGATARKLLRRLEQWTLDIGAKYLRMVAPAGSQIGTLYERRGYVAVESAYHKDSASSQA